MCPAVGVQFVCPEVSDTFVCEDNYFWLEPGESKKIKVNSTEGVEGFTAFNIADGGDTVLPEAPGKIKAEATGFDSVVLSWTAAKDDNRILQYEIYVDDSFYGYVKGTQLSASVEGLKENTAYNFRIVAVDGNMNRSNTSKTVSCATTYDNIAPYVQRMTLTDVSNATVLFSRKVTSESAQNTDYYILNNGARVSSATLLEDGRTVELKLEGIDESRLTDYTLTVIGVRDTSITGNYAKRSKFTLGLDMIGYWPLNEGGEILDYSNYHESAGRADESLWTEGMFGSGLATDENGVISLTMTDFKFGDKASTVAFWIKPLQELNGFNVLLCKGEKAGGHFELYTNNGELKLYIPGICDVSFGKNINAYLGKWTHLTLLTVNGKMNLYINGEPGRLRTC